MVGGKKVPKLMRHATIMVMLRRARETSLVGLASMFIKISLKLRQTLVRHYW